jgi:putative spermidine/putrescine transport system substrate-binding protein
MASRFRFPAIVLALGLVVGACTTGGASPSPSAAAPSAPASVAASASASAAAASGSPALAEVCTAPPKHEGTTMTFVSYGGAYQEAQRKGFLQPYSQLTGVQFNEEEGTDYAKIKSQVEAGQVTWDVVDVGNDFGLDANADLLEPLDYNLIAKDQILEGFAGTYRVGDMTYGVALAYNTEKTAGKAPTGWVDFFDLQKFPGKRGFWKYATGGVLEFALMADGVDPKELYPLDVDRAFKKLDTIKSEIVWWDTGAQSQERIGSGEVALTMIWNGRGWSAKNTDKKPVEIVWNQQFLTADFLVVPKGSPNKDVAMEFIAWATCANNNAAPSKFIPYGPTNKFSTPDPSHVSDLAVSNVDESTAYFDDAYLVENFDELDAKFQAWLGQ